MEMRRDDQLMVIRLEAQNLNSVILMVLVMDIHLDNHS